MRQRTVGGRAQEFVLYVTIALGVVAAAILYAVYNARRGESADLPLNWLGFGSTTALVFGYAIRATRQLRSRRRLWVLLGSAAAAQVVVGGVALWHAPQLPVIAWGVIAPLNYIALSAYVGHFLRDVVRSSAGGGPTSG